MKMEDKIYYFEQAKPENSDVVLGLVKKKAQEKVLVLGGGLIGCETAAC